MTRGRKVTTIALAVSIVSLGATSVLAQPGGQPQVRMLLNLDLFTPQTNAPASGDDDSTLHEIQALRAMGYLNGAGKGSSNTSASTTNSGPSGVQPTDRGKGGEVE
jgi:hypothetical protein